jgi:hypothetical protein
VIRNLTRQDILNDINTVKKSPMTGHDTDFLRFLGVKRRNISGAIVGAKSVLNMWYIEWDTEKKEVSDSLSTFDYQIAGKNWPIAGIVR